MEFISVLDSQQDKGPSLRDEDRFDAKTWIFTLLVPPIIRRFGDGTAGSHQFGVGGNKELARHGRDEEF